MSQAPTNVGELIARIYDILLDEYGDPELASQGATAVVNDLLSAGAPRVAEPLAA